MKCQQNTKKEGCGSVSISKVVIDFYGKLIEDARILKYYKTAADKIVTNGNGYKAGYKI